MCGGCRSGGCGGRDGARTTPLTPRFDIRVARTPDDIASSVALAWQFFDLVRSFPDHSAEVDAYLRDHKVREKFDDFPAHFLPPAGDCLLARAPDGSPLGVVMLTAKSPDHCEMNRMFVTEAARGSGLGRALGVALMDRAREMGFQEMTLDTLVVLQAAVVLYRALGFEDDACPGRYDADNPKVLNMRRSLVAEPAPPT